MRKEGGIKVVIATWNALAFSYATKTSHPGASSEALVISKRVEGIKNVLKGIMGVCGVAAFQEVDKWEDVWEGVIKDTGWGWVAGYRGDTPCGTGGGGRGKKIRKKLQEGDKRDRVLVTYDEGKYNVIKVETVDFDDLARHGGGRRFMRNNAGVIVGLECKATKTR
jgi:mRNA deadenylase 3'-5' endonuclease subunit Ccr4